MDRRTFTETNCAFKRRAPFRPFTVVTVRGGRHEIDHSKSLAINDGVAVFLGPGDVPVMFNFDGVSEIIGDRSGRGAEA